MKLVYICSPYRARSEDELDRNIDYAQQLTREVLMRGECPVTPHLYMTQCLDDRNPEEREIGLAAGTDILKRCDEVFVGEKYGISAGMKAELKAAAEAGIHVCFSELLRSAT